MLKRVEIRNFRSCNETNLELGRTLCAISGRNGVGKSNILKAIEWLGSSATSFQPIKLSVGNPMLPEVRTSIAVEVMLEGILYRYKLEIPSFYGQSYVDPAVNPSLSGLTESLDVVEGDSSSRLLHRVASSLTRKGDAPQLRLPMLTSAIATLSTLLANDDPIRMHVDRLQSFLGSIRYYSFEENSDPNDHVSVKSYNEWKYQFEAEKKSTHSVLMRLIFLWEEDRPTYDELFALLGPNGLNVIESMGFGWSERGATSKRSKKNGPDATQIYLPQFIPANHMGGAGGYFPYSELSQGTRCVIQIITSMLFDKKSLMLIEHPENSVHPGLLRQVIDTLRTYSDVSQVLLTTQSPDVLDMLDPEAILLATASGSSTRVRALSPREVKLAKTYLKEEGTLSDFLEPLDVLE